MLSSSFLWDRQTDKHARPTVELDAALGGDASAIISGVPADLDHFGIERLFDEAIGKLTIMDIDRAPNLAALAQLLILLYPHKLPLAIPMTEPVDPAKTLWTVVSAERTFETGDWDEVHAELDKRPRGGTDDESTTLH